eukprot:UN19831
MMEESKKSNDLDSGNEDIDSLIKTIKTIEKRRMSEIIEPPKKR